MTKAFLKFGNAPKTYSRRFPANQRNASAAFKTDAELTQERTDLIADLQNKFKEELNTRGFMPKTEAETLITGKITDQFKDIPLEGLRALAKLDKDGSPEIMQTLAVQGAKILELENRGNKNEQPLSIRAQVKEWAERNKEAIGKLTAATPERATLTPLEIRVNSPMTPANSYSSGTYLPFPDLLPGINDIVRVQPTFLGLPA